MMDAESQTNSLTMKLLALANYCEGPKADEIKNVIGQLPVAAYKERTAADEDIARLRKENAHLKQRLAIEVLANRRPEPPPPPPRSWHEREARRAASSTSSSTTAHRDSHYTPPRMRLEDTRPPIKRLREESPAPLIKRPRPTCTGCFQIGGICDGNSECGVCNARGYGCQYKECWDGRHCVDPSCTRLHPGQWSYNEEPKRVVNGKSRCH